jgi:hypothetical protein
MSVVNADQAEPISTLAPDSIDARRYRRGATILRLAFGVVLAINAVLSLPHVMPAGDGLRTSRRRVGRRLRLGPSQRSATQHGPLTCCPAVRDPDRLRPIAIDHVRLVVRPRVDSAEPSLAVQHKTSGERFVACHIGVQGARLVAGDRGGRRQRRERWLRWRAAMGLSGGRRSRGRRDREHCSAGQADHEEISSEVHDSGSADRVRARRRCSCLSHRLSVSPR